MPPLKNIFGRIINDSRGEETIEASIVFDDGTEEKASAPSGKSRGSFESVVLPAGEAVALIESKINPVFSGKTFSSQMEFDESLIKLDGTENKSFLGGNSTIALSVAFSRAMAKFEKKKLFSYFNSLLSFPGGEIGYLRLFANVINGGLHAKSSLPFQEHIVIPKAVSFKNQFSVIKDFFESLGDRLKKITGAVDLTLGDEGGYAVDLKDEEAALSVMEETRASLGLTGCLDFGLDVAASNIKGKTNEELFEMYKKLRSSYGLIYIEDPYDEKDFDSFNRLKSELAGVMVCGDDLTVTNVKKMKQADESGSVNAVIVKPNQIGTIWEAIKAVDLAKEKNWAVVVSHRSGETMDDWISDFAVGCGAEGFKLGAPSKPERLIKYERLLEIEKKD